MATATEPRPLADLEQGAIARVEAEFARRARGTEPWTTQEYVERITQVHVRYNHRRQWLRTHKQETAS